MRSFESRSFFATANAWLPGKLLMAFAIALACTACGKPAPKATSQVAIKINGDEVSMHQVDLAIQRQVAGVSPEQAASATQRIIENLVDEELAAQAARKLDIDKDPRIVQMLEANKRETLARAYLDRKVEKALEPTSDQIDAYYTQHPALFNERKVYSLQETTVAVQPNHFDALKTRVQGTASLEKMLEALRSSGARFAIRQLTVSAEDVPFGLLEQLAALKDGQSLMQPREGGARIITVLQGKLAPLERSTANRVIIAYLRNENRSKLLQQEVKALRDTAKIDYSSQLSKLTALASVPASAAAASAANPSASSASAARP